MAESLATVTPAPCTNQRGRPTDEEIRRALYGWAFVALRRQKGQPPKDIAATLGWLERNTVSLADLEDRTRGPELIRHALDALAVRTDGRQAAASAIARKRAVFYNALAYAADTGFLNGNTIDSVAWRRPKSAESVDRRVVVDRACARTLLTAVAVQPGVARRLVAFFGLMYYAALRPGEALDVRTENLACLPETGWRELLLGNSSPRSGTAWTDSGRSRERRQLKHRARKETRRVPVHPELV
jgi:integrase